MKDYINIGSVPCKDCVSSQQGHLGLGECFCLFDSRYAQPVDLEVDSVDPAAERVQQLVENQKILHRFPVDEGARPLLDRLLEFV
jgi:hypothetical protein